MFSFLVCKTSIRVHLQSLIVLFTCGLLHCPSLLLTSVLPRTSTDELNKCLESVVWKTKLQGFFVKAFWRIYLLLGNCNRDKRIQKKKHQPHKSPLKPLYLKNSGSTSAGFTCSGESQGKRETNHSLYLKMTGKRKWGAQKKKRNC